MTVKERNQLYNEALKAVNGTTEEEPLIDEAVPLGEITVESQLDRMNNNLEFQNEFYGLMAGVVIVVFLCAAVLIVYRMLSSVMRG